MITINADLLRELGLGALPLEERNALIRHIYDTLELRVGNRLARAMSDEQLTEFEQFMQDEDPDGATAWLHEHFPDHPAVTKEEFARLKAEIAEVVPQMLKAAGVAPSD